MLAMLGVALLASLTASIVLTPFVRAVARRYGLVVRPRDDRWHTVPTALYGGVAIAAAACIGVAVAFALQQDTLDRSTAVTILIAALALFAVGVVDDARGMSPVAKLIAQIAGGSFLVWSGLIVALTPWMSINVLVTMFWFVGISNALNLLDNMDGVAAGVAAVASFSLAALFWYSGDAVHAAFALVIAGSALGFLVFNFKPASIFMGDAGSLFLGGALAGLGATYSQSTGMTGPVVLLVPVLILIVPIVDTTLVTLTRVLNNRSIAVGGRDHSTHRLVTMGFGEARAAAFLYVCGALSAVVAFLIADVETGTALWVGALVLTSVFLFAAYLGTLYEYDNKPAARRESRARLLRNVFVKRRGFVVLLDMVLFGAAYYGSFVIYFGSAVPARLAALAASTLGVVIVLKIAVFNYFGVYRTPWNQSVLADVHRVIQATILASLVLVFVSFLVARGAQVPRAVFVMDMLLTGAFTLAARMSFGSFERLRQRLGTPRIPALIIASRAEIDPMMAAIAARPDLQWRPVGIAMDGDEHVGEHFHGIRVIGRGDELHQLIGRGAVEVVVCGHGALTEEVRRMLASVTVRVVQFRAEFVPTVLPGQRPDVHAASGGAR